MDYLTGFRTSKLNDSLAEAQKLRPYIAICRIDNK